MTLAEEMSVLKVESAGNVVEEGKLNDAVIK
jgi:hypothetical protein